MFSLTFWNVFFPDTYFKNHLLFYLQELSKSEQKTLLILYREKNITMYPNPLFSGPVSSLIF